MVRNNTFTNVTAITDGKILISGHPESRIEDLIFDGLTLKIVDEQDFSKAKKPRGNKNYPNLKTSTDLAKEPGFLTLGFTNDLRFTNVKVYAPKDAEKEALYLREVNDFENINFKSFK